MFYFYTLIYVFCPDRYMGNKYCSYLLICKLALPMFKLKHGYKKKPDMGLFADPDKLYAYYPPNTYVDLS